MTTRLYKINGVYNTWQYWHDNYGYSESPSQQMSFKKSDSEHWGENAGDGYALNSDGELSQWSMWSDGIVGWFGANDLAEQGAYPASSADLFVERTGEQAKAVSLDDGTNTYYLIDGYLDLGWRLWEVLEAEGWQISSGGELAYIIVDEDTGEIVFSQNDPGMEFAEVGTLLMQDSDMILVPEASLPLATFYLNPEGRDATENHTLTLADNPVFDAGGNDILYADYPDLQGNTPFCFMRVDNTFFMGGEGDSLINLSEGKAGIGALASRGKSAWSVSFEVQPPTPLVYDSASGTISALSLPTSHSGDYVNVKFDSLRYYVKGTLSNTGSESGTSLFGSASSLTWYYGTVTWDDSSLGDLSDKIAVNPPTSDHTVSQTYFRIIFINRDSIFGYHPQDTSEPDQTHQITAYSYNNGVHSITFYCVNYQWWAPQDTSMVGRIQFRYLDGTTMFEDLDAFDLIAVNGGVLSKDTTTDRYDMYSAWGGQISIKAYYPQQPAPTELTAYFTSAGAGSTSDTEITWGNYALFDASGAAISSDDNHNYTLVKVYDYAGNEVAVPSAVSIFNNYGTLCLGNNPGSFTAYRLTYTVSDNT